MKTLVIVSAACGVGKSTIQDEITERNLLENYVCLDTDEVGIDWAEYANTEYEQKYSEDCLAKAVELSGSKNLLFVTCMNPMDFFGRVNVPEAVTATYYVGMTCSDEEVRRRLKARPAERMCGSDEFIAVHIDYNNWFRKNAGKFQLYIDNTHLSVEETAEEIVNFVKRIEGQ